MILFITLLINSLIGHYDFQYKYISFATWLENIGIFFEKLLGFLRQYPVCVFFGVVMITAVFGYFYQKSIDPMMAKEIYLLTYSSWLNTYVWFVIYFFIFIDLVFYLKLKKIWALLKCEDFTNAQKLMSQITQAPINDTSDIYNELVIWITHNSLYRIFLPLFYYMLGDLPFVLGYYLLYPFFKQLPKLHYVILYFPIILLAMVGTILSVLTGNIASIIDEAWGAIRYCSKNKSILQNSNANYLSVGFTIATGINLKYHNIYSQQLIDSPKIQKEIEQDKLNEWVIRQLLKERNVILPIYALCLGSVIKYFLFSQF